MRRHHILLTTIALALAACSPAAEPTTTTTVPTTTTTAPTTTTTTIDPAVVAARTCDDFKVAAFDLDARVQEAFGDMDLGEDAEAVDEEEIGRIVVESLVEFYDGLAVAAADAPPEIASDLALVAEAVAPWRDALESGADLESAIDDLDPAELFTGETADAVDALVEWTDTNCDAAIAFDAEEILFSTIFAAMFGAIGDAFGDLGDVLGDGLDDPTGDEFSFAVAYGDDPELDALYEECGVGNGQACTDVYFSGFGEYELWGQTCGALIPLYPGFQVDCPGKFGTESQAYGDDFVLDSLWDSCSEGDPEACDGLFAAAPIGSEYEAFGSSCGDTRPEGGDGRPCVFVDSGEAYGYGDDERFDQLWDACSLGDSTSCSDLYFETPFDSAYEAFGLICGDLSDAEYTCENVADWLGGPVG